jgi:hypothetical protein
MSRKNCDIKVGITSLITANHHKAEIFIKSVCSPSSRVVHSADSFESRSWSELAREMPSSSHVLQHFTNDSRMYNSGNGTSTPWFPFPRNGGKNFFFFFQDDNEHECNDELWAMFVHPITSVNMSQLLGLISIQAPSLYTLSHIKTQSNWVITSWKELDILCRYKRALL